MRGYEFLEKMGLIDPEYVEAADQTPVRRISIWLKLGAVAACIAIIVAAILKLPSQEIPQVDPTQEPTQANPTLPTVNHSSDHGGFGFEGYSAYDISEITNCNPWYDTPELVSLPVYDNLLSSNGAGEAWGADIAELKAFALDVAARLGIDSPTMEYRNYRGDPVPEDSAGPTMVIIEADGVQIEVDQMMSARIDFEPAISLPEEFNPSYIMSYDEALAIAEYLKIEYSDLMGMDNPKTNVRFDGPGYQVYFYNGNDNLSEKIINYNFRSIKFWCGDEGVSTVIIKQTDLSHKVADYPILSAAEAQTLLVGGLYATNCGYEFPGREYIGAVELVYRNSVFDDYYIPYYRFYVELPEEQMYLENGLKCFGAFYVPAIDTAYISDFPTYDGRFN